MYYTVSQGSGGNKGGQPNDLTSENRMCASGLEEREVGIFRNLTTGAYLTCWPGQPTWSSMKRWIGREYARPGTFSPLQ